MYGWGDDMSDWKDPVAYKFEGSDKAKADRAAAAKASADMGGRTYLKKTAPAEDVTTAKKTIYTSSATPVVVAVDVTGSMQHWPAEIFDRLPLLYQTLSQYREEVEVSFIAIGDAHSDRHPLQVTDFRKGIGLEETLNALYGEGGGGGQARESYELLAYQLLYRCRCPEAVKPLLILYGDEGFYEQIDPAQVRRLIGDDLKEPVDARAAWRAVAEAWNVWHLRKAYHGHQEKQILAQWQDVLGPERVIPLDDEKRAVDLALGIIARQWGRLDDFEKNLAARQDAAVVARVADRVKAVRS
jgi:(2Fe-2S) ferredoxin